MSTDDWHSYLRKRFKRRLKQNRLDEFGKNAFRGEGRVYWESEGLGRSLCRIR